MLRNSHWKHTVVLIWNRKHIFLLLDKVGYFCLHSFASGRCCSFAFSPSLLEALGLFCETPSEHSSITLYFGRQCLLAGTNAIITVIFCSSSGKADVGKVISAPLWQILPFVLALER